VERESIAEKKQEGGRPENKGNYFPLGLRRNDRRMENCGNEFKREKKRKREKVVDNF